MARQVYKPVDPVAQMYRAMLIQRLLRKQQAEQVAAREAAQRQMQIEQERLVRTPGEGWSAAPGARNTNVPFIMGEGGQHGYDELYAGSPYADQGRNWASPGQWERYTDHGMTDDGTLRLPDWLRTAGSGLGPAFEPSPELQELRGQVGTLREMGAQNAAMRGDNSNLLDQLARAVQYAEEDRKWEEAWDEYRGVKSVAPGIADIYGPYDDSQDRYADAPAKPGMIGEAFPENPMPPPAYGWGAEIPEPDRITGQELARPGLGPKLPTKGKDRKAWATGPITEATAGAPYRGPDKADRFPSEANLSWGMPRKIQRIAPSGLLPAGEDSPPPGRAPYLMPSPQPRMPPDLGIAGGGGWAQEATPQTPLGLPVPEGPSMWDNHDPEFTAAMHSGNPTLIEKYIKSVDPWAE